MKANKLATILKESSINFGGSIGGMGLRYLSVMIMVRFLSSAQYGIFTLSWTIISFSGILGSLALPKATARFIPYYNAREEAQKANAVIRLCFKITVSASLIAATVLFVFSDKLAVLVFHKPALGHPIRLFVLTIPFSVFTVDVISVLSGLEKARYHAYINRLFLTGIQFCLLAIVLSLGYGLGGAILAYVIATIVTAFFAAYFLGKKAKTILSVEVGTVKIKDIMSYSTPLLLAGTLLKILSYTDILMLGALSTSINVAIYRVCLLFSSIFTFLLVSFGIIYMPVISGLVGKNDSEGIKSIYQTITRWIFVPGFGLFLFIVLFSQGVLTALFTQEYSAGYRALQILALGYLIHCAVGPDYSTLEATGRTKLVLYNVLSMLFVNVTLNYLLIPKYGITGAAIATSSSFMLKSILGLSELFVLYRLQPFTKEWLKYIFCGMVTVGIAYFVKMSMSNIPLYMLVLIGFLFFGIYFALIILLKGLGAEELMMIRTIKERFLT